MRGSNVKMQQMSSGSADSKHTLAMQFLVNINFILVLVLVVLSDPMYYRVNLAGFKNRIDTLDLKIQKK